MKKAFSLVELMVVICLIGILSAVMLGAFSGGSNSARAARCMTNLRNLAQACQTYGSTYGRYPNAGSLEIYKFDESSSSSSSGKIPKIYYEEPGWVSWKSMGMYSSKSTSSQGGPSLRPSVYDESDKDVRLFCLTNGALWTFVSRTRETFLCPVHAKEMKSQNPFISYVMNGYFAWDRNRPPIWDQAMDSVRRWYNGLTRADRRLLFAEIPFVDRPDMTPPTGTSGEETDTILQYDDCSGANGGGEIIGFNHKSGKLYHGHVAFADGHVEKLIYPKGGISKAELVDLTKWLCEGKDYSFNGSKYEELELKE